MRLLLLLVVLAGLAWFGSWAYKAGVIERPFGATPPPQDAFVLSNVRINLYDDDGRRTLVVYGRERALVRKDLGEVVLNPIRVVDERTVPSAVLTARRGTRRVVKKVSVVEFEGDVFVERGATESLSADRLLMYPDESVVEVPVRSTIRTTDTTVEGDFLHASTTLNNGTVRGDVRITRRIVPESGGAPVAVYLRGDTCPFDARAGTYDVSGNVELVREGLKITCREAGYRTATERTRFRGAVAATDADVILTCEELDYDMRADAARATGDASASRTTYRVPDDPSSIVITELHAAAMTYRRTQGTLDAEGKVRVVRYVPEGASLLRDFEIWSDTLAWVYGQAAVAGVPRREGRSNFTGNVRIESVKVGAMGERAVFYEDSRNFYVIGNARAWSYDAAGRRTNEIAGGKILHDGATGRNVVIEGVQGVFSEDEGDRG